MRIIKKYSLLLVVLLQSVIMFGQEIKTELPTLIPPSPTVAALMKFDGVPVNNYTGIPDVSIPLANFPTLSKDINLDISLKYHSGIGANDRASDVGLGWSLITGGTVSRTVRGLPDEILSSGQSSGRVGLYQTTLTNYNNYYYEHENDFPDFVSNEFYTANEYIWDIVELGRYDTEHDLWQFNFMGNSGRFYIRKNLANNQLEIVPLDSYRVKIVNHYAVDPLNSDNLYIPTGFTIYDEKGYRYEFDVVETTVNHTAVGNGASSGSLSADKVFKSAFHLSKIYDSNNNLLVEYLFDTETVYKECVKNSIITINDYSSTDVSESVHNYSLVNNVNCFGEFRPIRIVNSYSNTIVQKIQTIDVKGIAKIDFTYIQDRDDTNLELIAKAPRLKSFVIKNQNDDFVKKYNFTQDYSTVIDTRMMLKAVEELNASSVTNKKYEFFYKENDSSENVIGKDYWGYFNLSPSCSNTNVTFSNEPSPSFSTTDILQKIKYPTGGCTLFDFEANRYSFEGENEITNFSTNPDNFEYSSTETKSFSNSTYQTIAADNTGDRKVKFFPSIVQVTYPNTAPSTLTLYKKVGSVWETQINLICSSNDCCIEYVLEEGKEYAIGRNLLDINYTQTDSIEIKYYTKTSSPINYLYGGGNRIKRIGYFDEDVDQDYYNAPGSYLPKKEKIFNYNWPGDASKSSGSLVFVKPLFDYPDSVKIMTLCSSGGSGTGYNETISFKAKTNFNNLISLRTQGADVGYKYVTVKESGNGSVDYEYSSPIDYPEEIAEATHPPFLPSKNIDYKRGLLIKETVRNQNSDPVKKTEFGYEFEDFEVKYGIRRYKESGTCYAGINLYSSYGAYLSDLNNAVLIYRDYGYSFDLIHSANLCGQPTEYSAMLDLVEAYGWAKLTSKTIKDYFYDASNNPGTVETLETYTYHDSNKQIDEQTVTNSLGETLKTKYYYLETVDNAYSKNNISQLKKVETSKDGTLLSTSQINYSTGFTGNLSYLPETITTAKADQTLEPRVRYTKYDEFGHPLELQQENGTTVCYIWGYNHTQPIAKIENSAYETIDGELINTAQIASNSSITGIESGLLSALTAIRTALPNAMVTTYTYIPIVGISTITDPKGYITTYEYDTFGRLATVKDAEDNVLSANEYHYRP